MPDDRTRLMLCFSAVFPALRPYEIAGARPDTVTAWDSIAHVTLLAVVEEEFGGTMGPEEIEHLTSFAALLDYVGRKPGRTSEPRTA